MSWKEQLNRIAENAKGLSRARRNAALWMFFSLSVLFLFWYFVRPFRSEDTLLIVTYEGGRSLFRAEELHNSLLLDETTRVDYLFAGSPQQAQALAEGMIADAVCLSSSEEIDHLAARHNLLPQNWQDRYPHGSSPFYSCIVFLVRASEADQVSDWIDLANPELRVSMPDPRTSGAGRYAYLALAHASKILVTDQPMERLRWNRFITSINFISSSAPNAFDKFHREGHANVFLTWESEALRIRRSKLTEQYRVVYPSFSIKGEPVVAILDKHTQKRGTYQQADNLLRSLYSDVVQARAAALGYRPRNDLPGNSLAAPFGELELFTVDEAFGSWQHAWFEHLSPKGSFQQVLAHQMALRCGQE